MRTLMKQRLAAAVLVVLCAMFVSSGVAYGMDWSTFNAKVTKGLGAEVTLHTRRALAAEAQTESGGGGARNNLFNTTLRMPGSTTFNIQGVQNYPTGQIGVEATIRTLKENGHGYWRIRQALRANASAETIVRGFGLSAWGTNLELVLAVLDDIRHSRWPNTLANLEARQLR